MLLRSERIHRKSAISFRKNIDCETFRNVAFLLVIPTANGECSTSCRQKVRFAMSSCYFLRIIRQSIQAGGCGDFHLIYTSFSFPSRRGIQLKSWSSHPLPGYLLAAQRSICFFFHGCQQRLLPTVLGLAVIICFTKGVPCVENRGLFSHFHLHKK